MEHGSAEEQLVLDFVAAADVGALHADEAEHHAEETQSQAAHEQPAHPLHERWGGKVKVQWNQFNFKALTTPSGKDWPDLT